MTAAGSLFSQKVVPDFWRKMTREPPTKRKPTRSEAAAILYRGTMCPTGEGHLIIVGWAPSSWRLLVHGALRVNCQCGHVAEFTRSAIRRTIEINRIPDDWAHRNGVRFADGLEGH